MYKFNIVKEHEKVLRKKSLNFLRCLYTCNLSFSYFSKTMGDKEYFGAKKKTHTPVRAFGNLSSIVNRILNFIVKLENDIL